MEIAGQFAVYCDQRLQDLYETQEEAEDAIDMAVSEEPSLKGAFYWTELDAEGDPV